LKVLEKKREQGSSASGDTRSTKEMQQVWDHGVQVEWIEVSCYLEWMLYVESVAAWRPRRPCCVVMFAGRAVISIQDCEDCCLRSPLLALALALIAARV